MVILYRLRLALALMALTIAVGAVGYSRIEGWSAFDGLYMAVITLSTVGFGEIHALSHAGRVFTLIYIVVGRVAEAYVLVVFTQLIIVEPLRDVLGRRRMERDLARLSDHYIVCGWGRMGQEIVEQIRRRDQPCVVIETLEEKCRRMAEKGILYVQGDASSDQALLAAGVERARGLVSVAPRDADNIFITLSARALNKTLFIVARSVYAHDVHKLEIAGADRVISPYVIGARRIAAAVFHPTVVDFLDLEVEHQDLEWELDDVPITPDSCFARKSLRECGIRQSTGCTVLAIRSGATQRFISNPDPDTVFQAGDTLVVLGTPRQLQSLERLAGLPIEPHPGSLKKETRKLGN